MDPMVGVNGQYFELGEILLSEGCPRDQRFKWLGLLLDCTEDQGSGESHER